MIKDAKLSEWSKELQGLERALDKDPKNEDLLRQRKNLKERMRTRTAKLIEDPSLAELPPAKEKGERQPRGKIKAAVKDLLSKGITDPVEIAKMTGSKPDSVRWYLWKFKNK